jgi:hypothetical protein
LTTCSYDISTKYDNALLPAQIAENYGVIGNPNAVVSFTTGINVKLTGLETRLEKACSTSCGRRNCCFKGQNQCSFHKFGTQTEVTIARYETCFHGSTIVFRKSRCVIDSCRAENVKPSTTTMKRSVSGNIMAAFANAPLKGSKPKPKEEDKPGKSNDFLLVTK